MTTTHTKEIGFVGVDSGLLMIGDPCYFVGQNSDAQKRFADWPKFLSEHPAEHQMKYNRGHDGLGVAFQTTHGDGAYPVYIQQNEHGKARFAIVVMDGTPIEEIIK
ncbi:MAG: hypothetical protein ACK5DE_12795 [Bacteroidota bacterium]|jgi:hypothetical protein